MTTTLSPETIAQAEQLFKADGTSPPHTLGDGQFDTKSYLEKYGIPFRIKTDGEVTLYLLEHCLFDPSHTGGEASIIQGSDGVLRYQCFHLTCKGRAWKEAREKISEKESLRQFCPSSTLDPQERDEVLDEKFLSDSELIPTIPFPFDVFPSPLRQFIVKVAESHHVSSEIVAASILPIIAASIGTGLRISPKKGWEVAFFIWLAVIEPTGAGKSPVLNTLMDPLFRMQKELWDEYQGQMKMWQEAEQERKNSKKKKSGGNSIHPTENEKPLLRHLFTSDCTVEALGRIFFEDGHGIVIYRDELGGLMLGFNQYKGGKGDDRQKYLSIFDCQPFKIDRKTETLFIKKCGASILGGIQPGLLPQILGETAFIDGLAQRFLLFHQEQTPKRFNEKALEEEDQTFFRELVRRSFDLLESTEDPQILILTEEARRIWADFYNELHTVLPFLSEKAQGFIPKAITYSLKFIGLLHVLNGLLKSGTEQGVIPWKPIIQKDAIEKGIRLSRFFLGQTIKALALYDEERKPVNGQKVRLTQILFDLREKVKSNRLSLGEIRDAYNEGLPKIATMPTDNQILSALLRSLGLETTRGAHGWATLIWNEKKLEEIFKNAPTLITHITHEGNSNHLGVENHGGGGEGDEFFIDLKEGMI